MRAQQDNKDFKALAILGSLVMFLGTLANAQSDAVRAIYLSAANVPTNISTVHTYPDPPKGFDSVNASAVELATYGFPQRPDKQTDPDHYAMWERAMRAAKIRWHGQLKSHANSRRPTPLAAAPVSGTTLSSTGPGHLSNVQASGVILNNGVTKWSAGSFSDLWTTITVPVVQVPFGNGSCAADGWYYTLSLAGIDGSVRFSPVTGNPLFQQGESVGVLEGIDCFGGSTFYEAVFMSPLSNYGYNTAFSLNPGDIFYTEIHAFGGCNDGSAFIEDLTTLTYNSYTIPNPCLVKQTGRYANFVVTRPPFANDGSVPDELSPLANTIDISFNGAEVLNVSGKPFYPGSQVTTTEILTMNEDSNTQSIELVNQGSSGYQGQHSLWFQTTGCAFTGGCNP